jgi:nucleotide-binding universal stress UspA family protein
MMFKTVAVGTDGSDTATRAVEVAIDIAERFEASLLIFSVYESVSPAQLASEQVDAPEDVQWSINPTEYVDAALDEAAGRARARGVTVMTVAREGEPAQVVCDLAAEYGADLLVIGNKGMQRRLFGSVPRSICQHAPCSVVLAKTT